MTTLTGDGQSPPTAVVRDPVRRLAEGTELLGEYQDSGYRTPKFLVRRADGQVMQLPLLLYRVACLLDGRDAGRIATDLSAQLGQDLTAEQVSYLVEERLRPAGLLAPDHTDIDTDDLGTATPPIRSDPLLALRYRKGVVPAGGTWRIAGVFRLLFTRPAWVAALATFVALDALVLLQGNLVGRVTAGATTLIHRPHLTLFLLALLLLSMVFHEIGHVTACRYGGARPGDMGVGLYLVWPALYSTVTDTYRLDRVGRLRTDLAGVYFNAIFMTVLTGSYLRTDATWLLPAILLMHVQAAQQFLPSVRFDGYYMLADLAGVPELFNYVGPVLGRLVPGRPAHPRVQELRPRPRRLIMLWVAVTVPMLLFYLVTFLIVVPRVLPVAWDVLLDYLSRMQAATRAGDVTTVALSVFQLFLMVLPWVGSALVITMLLGKVRRFGDARGWAWAAPGRWDAVRRYTAFAGVAGLAGALIWRVAHVAGSASTSTPGTGAVGRNADVLIGSPALSVLACAVLVVSFLTSAALLRWRLSAVVVPLAVVAAMGPAVSVLATRSPAVVGATWTAVGATILLTANRLRVSSGRRGPRSVPWQRVLIGAGLVAIAAGMVTTALLALPLAVGAALLALRTGWRTHLRMHGWVLSTVVVLGVTALAALTALALLRTTPIALSPAGQQVLLLVAGLTVVGASVFRELRWPAAALALPVLIAVLPAPGAAAVLPLVLFSTVVLGALLVQALTRHPVEDRPHPLLRAALVVPTLVVVIVGALL
jgi:putative peptide zinc metalloprotease protein